MNRADRRRHQAATGSGREELQQVGRIAFRVEGGNWNAYWAMPETMRGALYLGSIRMAIVDARPERKEAFMALMRDGIGDLLEEKFGARPEWPGAVKAPDHERTRQ